MPGEPYEQGGFFRGMSDLLLDVRDLAASPIQGAIRLGKEIERRGSTLPLLRRFSGTAPARNEYEAIPLNLDRSISPAPSVVSNV